MHHVEGLERAANTLKGLGIDALLVIGGNGSMQGALSLAEHWSGQIIGLPGTIDNDLGGTDWTIGFFTALDTALDAADRLRDTAEAFLSMATQALLSSVRVESTRDLEV